MVKDSNFSKIAFKKKEFRPKLIGQAVGYKFIRLQKEIIALSMDVDICPMKLSSWDLNSIQAIELQKAKLLFISTNDCDLYSKIYIHLGLSVNNLEIALYLKQLNLLILFIHFFFFNILLIIRLFILMIPGHWKMMEKIRLFLKKNRKKISYNSPLHKIQKNQIKSCWVIIIQYLFFPMPCERDHYHFLNSLYKKEFRFRFHRQT
ncbi:MAG: hypothetical protein GY710_18090 [Desulfobacteraceae bacterium]|nr:hypothetical protein [Desulfobacteraceae bacterium]